MSGWSPHLNSFAALGIPDLGMFVLKVLAVAGGVGLGALLGDLLVRFVVRLSSWRRAPRWVVVISRVVGAIVLGLAVWFWVFGTGGSGGWGGGGGGWWPFGQKGGPGTNAGAGTSSRPEKPPAEKEPPENVTAPATLRIRMRGGADMEDDQHFYVIPDHKPLTWPELEKTLNRRRESGDLKAVVIEITQESVDPDNRAVRVVRHWAQDKGVKVSISLP